MAGRRQGGLRPRTTAPRAARRIAAAAALLALTALTACGTVTGSGPARVTAAGGTGAITETGSSLLYPLMKSWAAGYQRQTPGVSVTTASTSSGTGIAAASAGTAAIGASDAYLSSGDKVKKPALRNIPLAVSAQTVVYNLPSLSPSSHVRLNGTLLAGIYDGTITMWDDPAITAVNPGLTLPAIKIVPVHRNDSSGDTFLFTSYLSTQDASWNAKASYGTTVSWPAVPAAEQEKGSLNMLHACEAAAGCVAYNGISYLSQAKAAGLGEAELANAAGQYTLPDAATIQASLGAFVSITPPSETISMIDGPAAAGYPIVNYEYAVVSTQQPDTAAASAIRAFLRWVITAGNKASYVDPVGFQPLPAALVTLGEQQIEEIGP
ncbi:MAG TPA: phosphate ABC transporter substrate-binding protein PstS [Trebonia sp.]|nr:phosphate ABC transporter substrate-binding protein PstS [Trebonia sp.]